MKYLTVNNHQSERKYSVIQIYVSFTKVAKPINDLCEALVSGQVNKPSR